MAGTAPGGTCKCHCESGDYSLGSYIDEARTEEEAAERLVLTCQMTANPIAVLRIPASLDHLPKENWLDVGRDRIGPKAFPLPR